MACGKEGGCGCCAKFSKKPQSAPRRRDNDYDVEDEYKVANFKRNTVSRQMNYSFLSTKAIQSMIDPRYISQSIVGKTWKIITVFFLLWIIFQVLMQKSLLCRIIQATPAYKPLQPNQQATTSNPKKLTPTKPKATTAHASNPTNPTPTKPTANAARTSNPTKPTPINPKTNGPHWTRTGPHWTRIGSHWIHTGMQAQALTGKQATTGTQMEARTGIKTQGTVSGTLKNDSIMFDMCTPYQKEHMKMYRLKEAKENDKLSVLILVFILGLYVKQLVARWWDQVKNLPEIDTILNQLSGLVFDKSADKTGVSPASLSLSKTVSRYALLSWTMCMSSISRPMNKKFNTAKNFIDKGLLTREEFEQLQGNSNTPNSAGEGYWKVPKSKDGWRDQWMIPLNWAICDANIASNKTKIIPKDHKNLVRALNRYQEQLRHLKRVDKNPLPCIYKQSVTVCMWTWLAISVIASQGEMNSGGVFAGIKANFPCCLYQAIKILMLFGWLKVSEMINNPFGSDVNFHINVVEKLDVEIWKASVAIKNIAQDV